MGLAAARSDANDADIDYLLRSAEGCGNFDSAQVSQLKSDSHKILVEELGPALTAIEQNNTIYNPEPTLLNGIRGLDRNILSSSKAAPAILLEHCCRDSAEIREAAHEVVCDPKIARSPQMHIEWIVHFQFEKAKHFTENVLRQRYQKEEPEEVLDEFLVGPADKSWKKYEPQKSPLSAYFLYDEKAALRVFIKNYNKRKNRSLGIMKYFANATKNAEQDSTRSKSPSDPWLRRVMEQAMAQLPKRQSDVAELVWLRGLDPHEAADGIDAKQNFLSQTKRYWWGGFFRNRWISRVKIL